MKKIHIHYKGTIGFFNICNHSYQGFLSEGHHTVPGEMVLIEGEEYSYDIDSLFPSVSKRYPGDAQNQRKKC